MSAGYRPARFLPGRHLMTVFGPLFRAPPRVALRRERWELPDGDFVDLDFAEPARGPGSAAASATFAGPAAPRATLAEPSAAPGRGTVVVLHGLEGSSSAHYVRGLVAEGLRRGLRAVALNFRGCSGELNRLLRSYHSGETFDLREVVRRLRALEPGRPLLFVGCSLGGNVLVKWLGEEGAAAVACAAVAVSVPFDLALCARTLDGPGAMSFVYRTRFLRTLKRKSLEKAARFPGGFDPARVAAARTLEEFDEALTGPVHGFAGAEDYWAQSSSGPFVARVRVPLLLLSAEDDPFIPAQAIPRAAAAANPLVTLEVHPHGGHLGFVEGTLLHPRYYAERRALDFLEAHLPPGPSP
jgi:predicted alpha/beta-fold hydrolase